MKHQGLRRLTIFLTLALLLLTACQPAALVIENSKVWGARSGTKDRPIILVTENIAGLLGTYYEAPQQLAMFEQVLDSFQPFALILHNIRLVGCQT